MTRRTRTLRTSAIAITGVTLALGLAACGGSSSSSSSSSAAPASSSAAASSAAASGGASGATGAIDCTAAADAMGNYGTSLADLAGALATDDKAKAVTAADGFVAETDALQAAFPGLPDKAATFFVTSKAVAQIVKDGAAGTGKLTDLTTKLQEQLGTPEFSSAGDAIEAYFREQCPTTSIPGDSASPAASGSMSAPPSVSGSDEDPNGEASESTSDGDN